MDDTALRYFAMYAFGGISFYLVCSCFNLSVCSMHILAHLLPIVNTLTDIGKVYSAIDFRHKKNALAISDEGYWLGYSFVASFCQGIR